MSENGETRTVKRRKAPKANEAWGARLTHDTSLYVIAAVIGFVLALFSTAVLTHFLSVAQFGQLALLLVFASFLTIFYNTGSLQGTFIWVFGSAGEEDIEDEGESSLAGTKKRALGTGMLITMAIAVGGTLLIIPLSPWLAGSMLHDSGKDNLIILAALSGGAGAVWRLVSNIMRMERKPMRFVVLQSVRPVLVVACVVAFVVAGMGVEGAILGTTVGGVAAILIALVVTRHSYVWTFERTHAKMILRRGSIFVPIIVSLWIAQNVDIYALSFFTSNDQIVGLYRLANRFAAFLDYFTAALFMAWTPLAQTPTFAAAIAQRGQMALGGRLLSYFVMAAYFLVLAMTAGADTLVRIAPPAYADAAKLIPLMGGCFLSYGAMISVYRLSAFPKKRIAYVSAAITSAVVFLASAPIFVPWLGAYGAGLSVINGFMVAAAGLTYFSQRGPTPLEIEWRRIGIATALAAFCLTTARVAGPALGGDWDSAIEIAMVVLYVTGLFLFGVITRDDREAAGRLVRQILPNRWSRSPDIEDGVRALSPDAVSALNMVVARKWTPTRAADELGKDLGETESLIVASLRRLDGDSEPTEHDTRIAAYLFDEVPVAEHDQMGRELWEEGVDPEDLHALESVVRSLKRMPKRLWTEAGSHDGGMVAPMMDLAAGG